MTHMTSTDAVHCLEACFGDIGPCYHSRACIVWLPCQARIIGRGEQSLRETRRTSLRILTRKPWMPSFLPPMCSCAKTTAHFACTAELVICIANLQSLQT